MARLWINQFCDPTFPHFEVNILMRLLGRRPESEYGAQLAKLIGAKPKILAVAGEESALLVGAATFFACRREGSWQVIGYHEVAKGGWKAEQAVLWWEDINGGSHEVLLREPGLFVELFTERVTATILVDQVVAEGDVKVRIVARRDLSAPQMAPVWSAVALDRTDPRGLEYGRVVDEQIARLKADYGIV